MRPIASAITAMNTKNHRLLYWRFHHEAQTRVELYQSLKAQLTYNWGSACSNLGQEASDPKSVAKRHCAAGVSEC